MPDDGHGPLSALIRDQARAEGALPFPRFMELALYHPQHGYYAQPGFTTGRRGDFATAPDAGPLFGATLARAVAHFLDHGPGRLVEVGPGSGRLTQDLLEHLPAEGLGTLEVVLVDPFEQHHERLQGLLDEHEVEGEIVEDVADVPPARSFTVLNEIFDALPAHVVERTETGWQALHVEPTEDGLSEAWQQAPQELAQLADRRAPDLASGQRYEVPVDAQGMIHELARISDPGVVAIFDYGDAHHQIWPHRPEGTLRGFREHRTVDPLGQPGATDITYDVDFSYLQDLARDHGFEVAAFDGQERLLVHLGLVEVARAMGELEAVKQLVVPGGGFGGRFRALVLDKGGVAEQAGLQVDLRDGTLWEAGLEALGGARGGLDR